MCRFLIGRQERVEKIDFQHVVSKSKHRRIKISTDLPSTKTLKLNMIDIKNFNTPFPVHQFRYSYLYH